MTSIPSQAEAIEPRRVSAAWLWAVAAAWAFAVVAAVRTDALGILGREFMPGYALLVALGITLPTAAYFTVAPVRAAATTTTGASTASASPTSCWPWGPA